MPSRMKKLSSPLDSPENITLLTVSHDQSDCASLRILLSSGNWTIEGARSCADAFRILKHAPPTVVACERDLPDGTWKDLMHLLRSLDDAPPVIVLSKHADEALWAEVLNLGGYDVLAKPFEQVEVERVLSMARRHGRTHGAQLSQAAVCAV